MWRDELTASVKYSTSSNKSEIAAEVTPPPGLYTVVGTANFEASKSAGFTCLIDVRAGDLGLSPHSSTIRGYNRLHLARSMNIAESGVVKVTSGQVITETCTLSDSGTVSEAKGELFNADLIALPVDSAHDTVNVRGAVQVAGVTTPPTRLRNRFARNNARK
ncbi:MAG: hypothetical protein ACLPQS_10490 [Acidimicrobiales bacterium]